MFIDTKAVYPKIDHNLSKNLSNGGTASERPFLFLVSKTTRPGLVVGSNGSPARICQWSNTHCGKACPPVFDLRSAVKPEEVDSIKLSSTCHILMYN